MVYFGVTLLSSLLTAPTLGSPFDGMVEGLSEVVTAVEEMSNDEFKNFRSTIHLDSVKVGEATDYELVLPGHIESDRPHSSHRPESGSLDESLSKLSRAEVMRRVEEGSLLYRIRQFRALFPKLRASCFSPEFRLAAETNPPQNVATRPLEPFETRITIHGDSHLIIADGGQCVAFVGETRPDVMFADVQNMIEVETKGFRSKLAARIKFEHGSGVKDFTLTFRIAPTLEELKILMRTDQGAKVREFLDGKAAAQKAEFIRKATAHAFSAKEKSDKAAKETGGKAAAAKAATEKAAIDKKLAEEVAAEGHRSLWNCLYDMSLGEWEQLEDLVEAAMPPWFSGGPDRADLLAWEDQQKLAVQAFEQEAERLRLIEEAGAPSRATRSAPSGTGKSHYGFAIEGIEELAESVKNMTEAEYKEFAASVQLHYNDVTGVFELVLRNQLDSPTAVTHRNRRAAAGYDDKQIITRILGQELTRLKRGAGTDPDTKLAQEDKKAADDNKAADNKDAADKDAADKDAADAKKVADGKKDHDKKAAKDADSADFSSPLARACSVISLALTLLSL